MKTQTTATSWQKEAAEEFKLDLNVSISVELRRAETVKNLSKPLLA